MNLSNDRRRRLADGAGFTGAACATSFERTSKSIPSSVPLQPRDLSRGAFCDPIINEDNIKNDIKNIGIEYTDMGTADVLSVNDLESSSSAAAAAASSRLRPIPPTYSTQTFRGRSQTLTRRGCSRSSGRGAWLPSGRGAWLPSGARLPRIRTTLVVTLAAVFLLLDLLCASSVIFASAASKKKKKSLDEAAIKSKCSVCRSLVKKFMEGLERTKKSGYGGGNTAWEEKSLGKNSFAKSETRFVEVMERVCDDVSGETDKFYCGNIVEEREEDIEEWYQSDQDSLLEQVLCVEALKVCCPYGSFGSECSPCVNATSVFCNGRGECKGNGTRVGSGKCDCQWPYRGSSCDECNSGYFHDELQSNQTHLICEKCHSACGGGGCKGPEALHCVDCASGYKLDEKDGGDDADEEAKGCVDVDECESTPCSQSEFCRNSVGSYDCEKCDKICDPDLGCKGGEASDCVDCRDGAEWDADRKNCVVTDWEKYDESLEEEKKEKEEEGEEGKEEEEEEGEKSEDLMESLKARKAKLGEDLRRQSEPTLDALHEESVEGMDKDEL